MKIEVDVASGWRPTDPRPYDLEVRHDERRAASASPAKRKDSRSKPQRIRALRVIRRYGVPPQLAFDAWLDPAVARLWLFATASRPLEYVAIDAHVKGSFRLVDRENRGDTAAYSGEYIEIAPPRRLVFTLSAARYAYVNTRVAVEIAPLAKGCKLTLLHENVPCDHAAQAEGRWRGILYGLGATLDSASTMLHDDQE